MSRPPDPVPRDAATIILIRDAPPSALEVLLVARHEDSRSFGGAHVFPGGHVDAADRDPALQAAAALHLSPARAASRLDEGLTPGDSMAFWIAAIRELFEEAGVLLAAQAGVPLRFGDPPTLERFTEHRRHLIEGALPFAALVERERLELRTNELCYFSRWITPVQAPRRYDTRFFVARAPADQTPLHDARETTSAEWMTPSAALAGAAAGTIVLTPPTARTLEELEDSSSCSDVFARAEARRVFPILPKVVQIGAHMGVLYPGDAEYDGIEAGQAADPEHPGPLNRVIMDDAGWRRFRGLRG